MSKSGISTMAALIRPALLGGILAYAAIAQAQIDMSGLDKWRGLEAQRGPAARPEPRTNPSETQQNRNGGARPLTDKEIQKARQEAERMVATIRGKLSKPEQEAWVSWSETTVDVGATGGYLNTPPSPAGAFSAVAAGAEKTPPASM